MSKKILPTPEELRQLLRYEPETGKLYWKERPAEMFNAGNTSREARCSTWNKRYSGKEALIERHPEGYLRGRVMNKVVYAHRVAWAICKGRWPDELIDHINGDKSDNRIDNLRPASPAENARNSLKVSPTRSKLKGVHFHKSTGKWMAQITVNRKKIYLGVYGSEIDAHNAYRKAAKEMHVDFANFG